MLRSIIFTLTLTAALFAPGVFTPAEAVTLSSDRVFAYAEANYPTLFPGPAANQQFQQYTYRYYPTSKNYLGVDTANDIFWLGPDTGNVITKVGTVASFADAIIAWEALSASVTSQNGVTATGGVNSIAVSWTNTCSVCSWQLSTKGQGNNDPTISTVRPRGTTSYTITGLLPGQEYSINMAANRAGRWVNRALLTVTTLPIPPSGSWTPTDLNDQMSFTSYLASSSSELALAGLDNSLAPSVWICPPSFTTLLTECTQHTDGLTGVNAPDALQFDPSGNLFGMFTYSVAVVDNPTQTLIKKLPSTSPTWDTFKSFGGVSLSLDVTSTGVLTGSTYLGVGKKVNWGAVDFYDPNGVVIKTNINFSSSSLTAVAYDGQGTAYVGGLDYSEDTQNQPFASFWRWDRSAPVGHNFTKIPLPVVVTSITDMVSDGHGVVYIAGVDIMNNGKVWKYKNGVVTDTGLDAFQVGALDYSSNGYLVAAGQDNINYNGQVWYYNPQTTNWTSLGLTGGFVIVNVSVNNVSNTVYAVGKNNSMASTMWTYQ